MHGFSVTPVRRRRQPAQVASPEQMPDLIVLDLNMPEEDGLSIIRDLKQRTSVPIIMLTATASAIDRVVGLELGADDYLAKPCELRELLARIRSVLRAAQTASRDARGARRRTRRAPRNAHRVRFGTKWLDHDAQALRDDEGNEHPAHRLGIRPAQGLRRQSEAGALARPACWNWQMPAMPRLSTGRSTCASCAFGARSSPIRPARPSSGPCAAGAICFRRPAKHPGWTET